MSNVRKFRSSRGRAKSAVRRRDSDSPNRVDHSCAASARERKRRPDRRIGRTRARLGQALRKLMEERPLEKISVQDVIELAGVSRSAFYAHYDDKVDLLLSDMDEFLERMAMLLVVRNEQSNRIAPVREFFTHVGESVQIRGALARSERLQDFFDLAVEHFARGIEARLKQITELGRAQQRQFDGPVAADIRHSGSESAAKKMNRQSGRKVAVETSHLIAHALAGAFISLLNSWIQKIQPQPAEKMDQLFHELAWRGMNDASRKACALQGGCGCLPNNK